MANVNTPARTVGVAAVLCVVCSVIVSYLVVTLRPRQIKNADLDYKKNILMAGSLIEEGDDIDEAFSKIEILMVDLESGEIVTDVDAATYDQAKASNDAKQSSPIDAADDIAGLARREKYGKVFLTRTGDGAIDQIILYHRGKGLWSTMHGFIALDSDTTTVKGFSYYAHGETPGLGGEVDNAKWKAQWIGKQIYDSAFKPVIELVKGASSMSGEAGKSKIDALSGATITGNGVTSSLQYWFSKNGYGKFLERVRMGEF